MRKTLQLCIALVFCASVSVSAQELKPIEFDHIFDESFSPTTISNVRWMNDGRFYSASDGQTITRFNITNGESEVIFDGSNVNNLQVQGYEFSADENLILIETDVEQLWRRSTKANYFIYNRSENSIQKLTQSEEKQQYAQLNSEGNRAAFVQNNNLFWVDLTTGEQFQITEDGEFNSIINGAAGS